MPKKPAMRQHPIALGRGAKWWREQVRRNVSAIFDGLVRKGAKADRATMSRAYAFAIGSLVKHGYLARTPKGLMVTDKGLAKSREKLRTVGARKKHEHFEKQLALVRKGPARRPANKRKTRRNPPGSFLIPSQGIAKSIAENEYGPLPVKPQPRLLTKLKAAGWTDDELAGMSHAQLLVVDNERLYEAALARMRAEATAFRERAEQSRETPRPGLPRFLTAPVTEFGEERELTPIGQMLAEQAGDDPRLRRLFGVSTPEEQEAYELERSIRRGIARETRGRGETYVYRMAQGVNEDGMPYWLLITPRDAVRTGAQTTVARVTSAVRQLRQAAIIIPDLRAKDPYFEARPGSEKVEAVKRYYKQYKHKIDTILEAQAGSARVSASSLEPGEIEQGLAFMANNFEVWPTPEQIAAQADEAKRLFIVIHTRGGSIKKEKVPGGWEYFWHNTDPPYERVYRTTSRAAGMNAIMQLNPVMVNPVNVLPPAVMQQLFLRQGREIGERAESERQRAISKRRATAERRRASAEVAYTTGLSEFRMMDPEEQRAVTAAQVRATRVARGGAAPPTPRARPSAFEIAEEIRSSVGRPRAFEAEAPAAPDLSNLSMEELTALLFRSNSRRNRRR